MRKTITFLLLLAAIVIGNTACNNQKTAQEMLKEENKAIDRFINKNGFKVIKDYPATGVFGEKEFYKTNEGLYIHVIDSGNGTRARYLKDEVLVRFEGMIYFKSDTTRRSTGSEPSSFIYGNTYSYSNACVGWVIPLSYVGEESVVSLIVPSSLGFTSDQNSFLPVYYEKLKYTRFY